MIIEKNVRVTIDDGDIFALKATAELARLYLDANLSKRFQADTDGIIHEILYYDARQTQRIRDFIEEVLGI